MQPLPYAVGEHLRVINGPFAGFDAEIREVLDDRLKLRVSLLGAPVPIEAEDWQVERK
jgi:transcription antitermination factor NusG